ncbi:MAG: beta-glucuronidase [Clostridia bacterium]|nr:beta-glucuronidase [Clostridia bacterium]
MRRLFNEHIKRNVTELSGAWTFLADEKNVGEEQGWYNGLPKGETVIVPSVWNNELGMLNYEGCAWYEKRFISCGTTLMIELESVMTKATVWLDGKKLGEHYGAFTRFEFIVNEVSSKEHTLVVRVDNRIDKQSFPQRYTDWFNYGGIARDVYAHELNGISILTNHIVYELNDSLSVATVSAELELYNASANSVTSSLSVTLGNDTIYSGSVTLDGYERKAIKTPSVELSGIAIWDTSAPNLYTVVASTDTDDLIDKVGFRKIEVKNGDILLNGKSIELLGVNRHEEHPDWGFAFPAKLMKKDIDLILDMGCNTIRGSHYPQSKIFVDMLDEKGILFWSEIPMWGCGFGEEALKDPVVVARGLEMHKEMTSQYYNHPSIIIWGMHNEIYTPYPCTYDISKQYNDYLRKNGGNRLITHAANHPLEDSSMEFDDIICVNLYFGWYGGKVTDWDKFVVDLGEHIKAKGWEGKPVIMSEFGAGALAGFHSHFDTVRWSEEYQRDLLEYCIELFHRTEYMRGTYVWQFCNIRTSPSMDINRVRYFNNKGILDEYRNPKASYFKIRELYRRYQGK